MKKLTVEHLKQTNNFTCGAAALAMVYKYLKRDTETENKIWRRLKEPIPSDPKHFFVKTYNLATDAEKQKLVYFYGQVFMNDLKLALLPIKEFLSASIPVVVCQKISKKNSIGHFRVVTGLNSQFVLVNDPMNDEGSTKIKIKDFLELWKNAKNGEVIGGEFFAVFEPKVIKKNFSVTVSSFDSNSKHFKVSKLAF